MRSARARSHLARLPVGCASSAVEIDGVRRAELFRGFDGDRGTGRDLHAKAHDGLVHGTDLLHVEGAVGDALAVEDEELFEHPVDRAIRDEGRLDPPDGLPDPRPGVSALQEREAIRVEQGAATLRQGDGAAGAVGARSVVDETEQDEELRPCSEALVHGVRVQCVVFAQALVEAGERVVADEGVVLRQHAALFGVEEEDQAQDDREEAAVDVVAVAVFGERLAQQVSAGGVVGGL